MVALSKLRFSGYSAYCTRKLHDLKHKQSTDDERLLQHREWLQGLSEVVGFNHMAMISSGRDLRRFGSAACDLCVLSEGRVDSYFEFSVKEWDFAAAALIALKVTET
jgi:fructose-1,6-bisphosphatase/inositol monophosphatase family enzyme